MTTERHLGVLEGIIEINGRISRLRVNLIERINDSTYRVDISAIIRPAIGSRLRFGSCHESNACLLGFIDAVVVSTIGDGHVIEFAMTGPILDEMLDRLTQPDV